VAKICVYENNYVPLQAKMAIYASIGLLLLAMAGLSIRIILKKNGRFSSKHISQSKEMRERGIHCVNTQDYEARCHNERKINVKQL